MTPGNPRHQALFSRATSRSLNVVRGLQLIDSLPLTENDQDVRLSVELSSTPQLCWSIDGQATLLAYDFHSTKSCVRLHATVGHELRSPPVACAIMIRTSFSSNRCMKRYSGAGLWMYSRAVSIQQCYLTG